MNNITHTHEEIENLLYKNSRDARSEAKPGTINKNRLQEYYLLLDEEPTKREHIYKDYLIYV